MTSGSQTPLLRSLAVAAALAFTLLAATAAAEERPCQIGEKVQLDDGGTGTLAEVGTEPPHVGWFRISFDWSPKGEWSNPQTWKTYVAGTKIRCVQTPASAAKPPAPPPTRTEGRPFPPSLQPSGSAPQVVDCPFVEPPGSVSRSAKPSAQLFQRVIYERSAARIDPVSISAPKKVGMTFLELQLRDSYENTLTAKRFGDKRLHTGAPVGATIYPLDAKILRCDLHGDEVRLTVEQGTWECFKSKDDDWVCPSKNVKTLESRLIPAK